jgi:hypothetical protein
MEFFIASGKLAFKRTLAGLGESATPIAANLEKLGFGQARSGVPEEGAPPAAGNPEIALRRLDFAAPSNANLKIAFKPKRVF